MQIMSEEETMRPNEEEDEDEDAREERMTVET